MKKFLNMTYNKNHHVMSKSFKMRQNICFKVCLPIFTILLLKGCCDDIYKDAFIVKDADFVKTDTFAYHGTMDVGVLSVDKIMKTDKHFIISANSRSDIINVYDKDFHPLVSWGNKGHASNEFIMPQLCDVDDSTITILDNGKKEILVFDYAGNFVRKVNTNGKLYQQCKALDQETFLLEYKTHHSLSLYETADLKKVVFDFPKHMEMYKNPSIYFGFLEVSEKTQTIVYVHQYLRSIILLNYDGTIKRIIKREPQEDIVLNERGGVDTDKSMTYYWGLQILKNSFVVYAVNKSAAEIMDNCNQNVEFEEYDFDGNPIRRIVIDRFVSTFCIDGDKIYGELPEEENGLGIFVISSR